MDCNGRTVKSFENNEDCFGYVAQSTKDHVWPTKVKPPKKEGSNSKQNQQKLTQKSNDEKSNKTSGSVNEIRFAVESDGEDDSGKVIGQMYIKKDDDDWYKVEKIT